MNRTLSDPKKAYVMWGLLAVNVLIFFILEAVGDSENGYFMFRHGAMLTSAVSEDHEYWRLFTAMFLHFGANHIFNNMLVLFAVGTFLENGIGHGRDDLRGALCPGPDRRFIADTDHRHARALALSRRQRSGG